MWCQVKCFAFKKKNKTWVVALVEMFYAWLIRKRRTSAALWFKEGEVCEWAPILEPWLKE